MSARHLGRRWVLRSCGRALFRVVAERWEAGDIAFDKVPVPEAELSLKRAQVRKALASQNVLEGLWARHQSHFLTFSDSGVMVDLSISTENLVFLCNHAEARGFKTSMVLIERVWARASKGSGQT